MLLLVAMSNGDAAAAVAVVRCASGAIQIQKNMPTFLSISRFLFFSIFIPMHSSVRFAAGIGKCICRRLYLSSFSLLDTYLLHFYCTFLFAIAFEFFVYFVFRPIVVVYFYHSLFRSKWKPQNRYKNPHFLLRNNETVKRNYNTSQSMLSTLLWGHGSFV